MTTTSSPLKCLPQWAASLALLLMASANLYAQQPMAITLKGDAEVPAVTLEKIGDAYSITAVHLDLVAASRVLTPQLSKESPIWPRPKLP